MFYLIFHLGFNAIAPIIIYFWGQGINHDVLIFISAVTAVVSFHALNWRKNRLTYALFISKPAVRTGFIKVILTTTFMWTAGFIIPVQYTPFIFVFSYLGWAGFFGALIIAFTTRKLSYIVQTLLIGASFILFYSWTFNGYSYTKTIIGIIATFLTGLSLYLYLRYSRRLNQIGINSRQILALRYWLLLILPLIVIIVKHEFNLINLEVVIKGSFIGLITLVLPLYFGQICIEKYGSEKFAMFMGLTPILTFVLQFFTIGSEFNRVIVSLLLALAIVTPLIWERLRRGCRL